MKGNALHPLYKLFYSLAIQIESTSKPVKTDSIVTYDYDFFF